MIRETIISNKSRFKIATIEIAQLVRCGLENQEVIDQLKDKYQESETEKILHWMEQGVDHAHINYYTKPLKVMLWLLLLFKAYHIPGILMVTDFPLWGLASMLLIGPSLIIVCLMLTDRPGKTNYYLIMLYCLWSLKGVEWQLHQSDSMANVIFVYNILLIIATGGLAFYLSRSVEDGPLKVEEVLKDTTITNPATL